MMRMLRARALVEFVGGPADGERRHVYVDHETGEPSPARFLRQCGAIGLPVFTEYVYDLRPAPDGAAAAWHYVLRSCGPDSGAT
jgi:hypothetical protein